MSLLFYHRNITTLMRVATTITTTTHHEMGSYTVLDQQIFLLLNLMPILDSLVLC